MSDESQPIAQKRVLYTMPAMDAVVVERVPFDTAMEDALTLDVYAPPTRTPGAALPAVVLVTGYSDAGARKMFGCSFSEMGAFVSWARLIAASGLVAVTYTNRVPTDLDAVIEHVREYGADLGIDGDRLGAWGCSGHGPNALALAMQESSVALRCAALCYPCTMDLDGSTAMADASKQWGFVNACAGRSVTDLSRDVPLFIARAGEDQMPGLNTTLDRFVAAGLACNLPITLVNHARAPHAFDLLHDGAETREVIRNTLRFFQVHLAAEHDGASVP